MTVKKYLQFLLLLFLFSCNLYKVNYNKNEEPILGKKMAYSFNETLNSENQEKIDTTAYYIQVFERRYYNEGEISNPMVLQFHNDGYYKKSSLKYYKNFPNRTKESIWYGGKYRISENNIELEMFAPSQGGKTKFYEKIFIKGRIEGDKIIFDDKKNSSLISVYKKNKKLE